MFAEIGFRPVLVLLLSWAAVERLHGRDQVRDLDSLGGLLLDLATRWWARWHCLLRALLAADGRGVLLKGVLRHFREFASWLQLISICKLSFRVILNFYWL